VKLKERIFNKLFGEAEIANFNQQQLAAYEQSLKLYWDMQSALDTAKAEGKVEGKVEGERTKAIEIAISLLSILDDASIATTTGLDLNTVKTLRNDL